MEFNYGGRTPAIDALVLASSGLERIGQGGRISRIFPVDEMCPAVGQGVVVVEYAAGNGEVRELLAGIDHKPTAFAYKAERALLRALEGHCDSPIGGFAQITEGKLSLTGVVISLDGRSMVSVSDDTQSAPPEDLGTRVGRRMNDLGAQAIIAESRFAD
jgi:hydroxymethylbilane synthase